jgi:hypothetical protein
LASQSCSFDAYRVSTDNCFEGVTVLLVLFGVGPNGAAELAIDVEVDAFRGIIEEPNMSLWAILR